MAIVHEDAVAELLLLVLVNLNVSGFEGAGVWKSALGRFGRSSAIREAAIHEAGLGHVGALTRPEVPRGLLREVEHGSMFVWFGNVLVAGHAAHIALVVADPPLWMLQKVSLELVERPIEDTVVVKIVEMFGSFAFTLLSVSTISSSANRVSVGSNTLLPFSMVTKGN